MKTGRHHLVTALLTLAVLIAVPIALAAKPEGAGGGGGGGGGGKPGGGTGVVLSGQQVGPNYVVTGTGFQPGEFIALSIVEAGSCCRALNTTADTTGGFTFTGPVWGAGTYSVTASVQSRRGLRVVGKWSAYLTP